MTGISLSVALSLVAHPDVEVAGTRCWACSYEKGEPRTMTRLPPGRYECLRCDADAEFFVTYLKERT
jgi:hypothetical protein